MKSIEYLAGFFDGEGYIGCRYQKVWDSYIMAAAVTNNNKDVLLLFSERFGGTIHPPKDYGEKPGKSAWVWTVHGDELRALVDDLLPHLVVKKEQFLLAKTFPYGSRGQRVAEDVRVARTNVFHGLQQLKQEVKTEPDVFDNFPNSVGLEERDDVQQAVELYNEGKTLEEVAQLMDVSYGTVGYWMRQLGESRTRAESAKIGSEKRSDSVHNRPEAQQAKSLYESGMSASQVAREMGFKPATVNYWLRQMGVTRSLKKAQKLRRSREEGNDGSR